MEDMLSNYQKAVLRLLGLILAKVYNLDRLDVGRSFNREAMELQHYVERDMLKLWKK